MTSRQEPEVAAQGDALTFRMPSDMACVDRIVESVRAFCTERRCGLAAGCNVILRELLINAVEHGNRFRPSAAVEGRVVLEADGTRLRITVRDEGGGFDWRRVNLTFPAEPEQVRRRGYPLIQAFSESMHFNPKGNEVTVYARNDQDVRFEVRTEEDWTVVMPSGNLTAATAGAFRDTLLELVRKGCSRFRMDMERAGDIDSTGLTVFILLPKAIRKEGFTPELEVVNASDDVINLFRMTRMDTLYRISDAHKEKA